MILNTTNKFITLKETKTTAWWSKALAVAWNKREQDQNLVQSPVLEDQLNSLINTRKAAQSEFHPHREQTRPESQFNTKKNITSPRCAQHWSRRTTPTLSSQGPRSRKQGTTILTSLILMRSNWLPQIIGPGRDKCKSISRALMLSLTRALYRVMVSSRFRSQQLAKRHILMLKRRGKEAIVELRCNTLPKLKSHQDIARLVSNLDQSTEKEPRSKCQ